MDKKQGGRFRKQVCGKCKDPRHSTKECKVGHCLICGKDNHITEECNWLQQMKPLPKYIGYAAKGLRVLLVQSANDILVAGHIHPLAIVSLESMYLNETDFVQEFGEMFNWSWQLRAKSYDQICYLMRFPNKARLVELVKFKTFNLLGTGVMSIVQGWTLDH